MMQFVKQCRFYVVGVIGLLVVAASTAFARGTVLTVTTSLITSPPPSSANYGLIGTPLGGSAHVKNTADAIGNLTFSVSSAGPLAVNRIRLTFTGGAATADVIGSASLQDQNGKDAVNDYGATFATSSNSATWTFGVGPNGLAISAGASLAFTLTVSSNLAPSSPSVAQSLSVSVANPSDVQFTDGLDAFAAQNISVPASVVPVTINSITYPVGQ